jgi:hypothetical protein
VRTGNHDRLQGGCFSRGSRSLSALGGLAPCGLVLCECDARGTCGEDGTQRKRQLDCR